MKFLLVIIGALVVSVSACKLETSSATANSNAKPSPTVGSRSTSTQETNSNCSLTLADAPTISGLRLGMTPDAVLALIPGSKDDPEVRASVSKPPTEFGVSNFVIRPAQYQSKDKFVGINQVSLNLFDGRVSTLTIGYDGPAYSHVDKFVERVVKGTSLPPADQWEPYVGMDDQMKTLRCAGFEIRVFAGGKEGNLNYVQMTDLDAQKKLRDRRAKARAQATPSS